MTTYVGDRRAAREVVRARRRAVHAAGWGQVLQDWYVGLFITATLLTMLFSATGGAILRPDCSSAVCLEPSGYRLLALVLALLGTGAMLAVLRAVGPASADPGQATWLMSTPADRGVLLRGGVLRAGFVAVVAGSSWGVLAGFALAGGEGSLAAAATPVALAAAGGAAVTLVLLLVALRLQGGAVAPAAGARAVPDAELARAGEVVGALTASTLMLESAVLENLSTRRRLARRGRHASATGVGGPLPGVLAHEVRALVRRVDRVLVAGLVCVGALAVGLLMGRFVGAILGALAVFAVTKASAGGLGVWFTAPGLRRSVPAHPAAVTAVLGVPPFVVAVVGAEIALAALGLPWWGPVLLALGATAGVMRSSDPPPGLGAMVATPAGAVPVGLVAKLVHGTDLALGTVLFVLLADAVDAGPAVLALGVLLVVWQVLRDRD